MKINKYIGMLLLSLFILFQPSCSNDHDEFEKSKPNSNNKVEISLKLPTDSTVQARSTTEENESLITSISLFIFDSTTGNKEFSTYFTLPYTQVSDDIDMSRWESEGIVSVLDSRLLTTLSVQKNIHVVANISESKFTSITDENSLKSMITDPISADIPVPDSENPFLMHGSVEGHNFTTTNKASVSLIRNVAKISFTYSIGSFAAGSSSSENRVSLPAKDQRSSYQVHNVADRSYVVSASINPTSVDYVSYEPKTIEYKQGNVSVPEFYVTENLRTDYDTEENATFIILQVPYQVNEDSIRTDNYYKIMLSKGGGYKIERNHLYKINAIISSLGGSTAPTAKVIDGEVTVLPWNENTIYSDVSQTYLSVKETVANIGLNKDFYYETNAESSDRTLESGASWLTASFDGENNIKLQASVDTYTAPRSTTLKIKVKNLTKTITVNQAPNATQGSIVLNPKTIYLSEVSTAKDIALSVNPTSSIWEKMDGDASIASCNNNGGTGNQTLRFTRGTTYGNTNYKFLNKSTLEYDEVKVCNLNLTVSSEEINVQGDGGTFTESVIEVLGGDASWVVKSKSDWITSASNIGGELNFTAAAEPNENDRTGFIVIAHINDPNYTKEIKINQSAKYIVFPEFEYMVFRFIAGTNPNPNTNYRFDLDTATEISGTGLSGIDNLAVGALMKGSREQGVPLKYMNLDLLEWGGDNRTTGYETSFVNIKNLVSETFYDQLPRYSYVNVYATWSWVKNILDQPTYAIDLEITLYQGGVMQRSSYDYNNIGGTEVKKILIEDIDVSTKTVNEEYKNYRSGSFTKLGSVKYDKLKNNAVFERD